MPPPPPPCPAGAGVHAAWTPRALAGAFLDLAIVYAFLCAAAAASAASALLDLLLGLPLPCTCSRPHLPCLFGFLARYPARVLHSIALSLRSRFPFASVPTSSDDDDEEDELVDAQEDDVRDLNREAAADQQRQENVRSALQQELDKERSAAASAAEEAMAMILRLQKEKSSLEIEARQQRRTADERCAFYEDEVEELRDILLMREREARSLQKEVESYRRLLGLSVDGDDDDDGDEVMMTPHNFFSEGDPSSSRSAANDSAFSTARRPFVREELLSPIRVTHPLGGYQDTLPVQVPPLGEQAPPPLLGSKLEDDGADTVVILPLSARSLDFPVSARSLDQGGDVEVDAAAGIKAMEALTADEFQEARVDKICHDFVPTENDANVFDVHVVDDICFTTEVKGLIGRSFSDAAMQADKLQNRAAADDLLGKSLNAIKGAQDKIRLAANERRQSLQLQLLEDIADQLQDIKDAADAGRNLHCISPKSSKKI
ncbi:uncharacterized protein [Lolium perenne]|uniref:uncharacterized protein n=1 Tax=Lolium perenne TaxID=4522 RepID=UPI0021EB3AD9|nr:uncharacterized protein LOC127334214 [Lolium perenne]XP_051216593.1 uncharacterized protein LOC127334214 [Lolium perenne]